MPGRYPKFVITINGKPVSGLFLSLLKSVTINDRKGVRSDSIELDLNDGPPVFSEIPSKDAIIRCWGGYADGGLVYFGSYKDADVSVQCLPYGMRISAKAADVNSKATEHQERHWDGKTVGDVFGQLAGEAGLQLQIAPALASMKFPRDWTGMQNESIMHFGRRQAERLGADFGVKDGKMLMVEKGKGQSASGAAMGQLVVTPPMIVQGTCEAHFSAREKPKDVKAEYQDLATGKRETVTVPGSPDGKKSYTLRHSYGDKDEAERAAKGKAREAMMSADTTSVEIEGNTAARGGAPMTYAGVRPGLDGQKFIIETAAHSFSKSGYKTKIDAKAEGAGGGE